MSVGTEAEGLDRRDRVAVWLLLALIVLSVLWPAPVLWLNERTVSASLAIDHEAFLGREALQWDVVFWWITGLALLGIARTDRSTLSRSVELVREIVEGARLSLRNSAGAAVRMISIGVSCTAVPVVLLVLLVDPLVHGWLISADQSGLYEVTSLANRFGGGVAPTLTTLFIGVAGVARGRERLLRLFLVIVGASAASGLVAQTVKFASGRSRPELWHGATDFWSAGASFPSGHALSVFVVGGAVALAVRSVPVRVIVLGAACVVAVARVLTFRHWPSDVAFSALLGLGAVWCFHHLLRRRVMKPPAGTTVVEPD